MIRRFVFICALFAGLFPTIVQAQENPSPDESSRDNVTVQDVLNVIGNGADAEARDDDLITLDGIQHALRRGTTWYSQYSWLGNYLRESPVLNSLEGVYPDSYDDFALEVITLAGVFWLLYSAACVIYPCKPFRGREDAKLSLIASFFAISIILPSVFIISLPLNYEHDGGFILTAVAMGSIHWLSYSATCMIHPTYKPFRNLKDTALFLVATLFIIFIISPPFTLWFSIIVHQPPNYVHVSDGGLILALIAVVGVLWLLYSVTCKIHPPFKPLGRLRDTVLSLLVTFLVTLVILPSVLFWYGLMV